MRFLTRAWHAGDLSDEESDAVGAAYRAHRAAVLPSLPPAVRRFAETVDIHDGLLQRVVLDRPERTLRLDLRCGDLQRGYFDLSLTYRGVRLDSLDAALLTVIAREPTPEALHVEEDAFADGAYVHRWLWWPFRRELDVVFGDLEFRCEPRADRRFERVLEPYVEIGAAAV